MIKTLMWVGGWTASLVLAFFAGRNLGSPQALTPSLVPADMALAARNALGQGSPMVRLGQSTQVLQHLNAENLDEVLAVYEMMLSGLGDCDLRIFSDAWAQFDPRGAFDHAMGWEWSHKRVVGSDAAIRSWAIRDPIEAASALPDIVAENSRIQNRIVDNFVVGWAHSGQPGLDEYIAGIKTQAPEKYVAQVQNAILRRGGPEAVHAWSDGILQDEDYSYGMKRAALRTGLRTSARWDPELSAEWVAPYLEEEWADDGPRIMADQWGKHDGLAAMEWVRSLPEGSRREAATRAAFVSWMKNDEPAAEAWLLAQELLPFHDPALNYYARELAKTDSVRSLNLCEQVQDEKRRMGCLKKAAKNWYRVDAVAAEAWLQESPMDEETRAQVRRADQRTEAKEGEGRQRPKRPGAGGPRRR